MTDPDTTLTRRDFVSRVTAFGAAAGVLGAGRAGGGTAVPAPWPNEAGVRTHRGRPTLFINDEPTPPLAYMSYLGETRFYGEMADAGIHLYCFPANLGDRGINTNSGIGPFRTPLWVGEGRYDFSSIEDDFTRLLRADPGARAILRVHLDPPLWWEEAHPEACTRLPDGTTFRQCFSSPLWRAATAAALNDVLDWLRASPFAPHTVGIHVAAGFTEEWFYHFRGVYHDLNPARTRAFRDWLSQAYGGSERELHRAWRDPAATFAGAEPADISGTDRDARWLARDDHRRRFDTLTFHTATMAELVDLFCRVVKEHSAGRLLTGAFYGYHFFVTDPRRGHGPLAGLLESPHLDYLSSPNAYNRVLGGDWPPMLAVSSVLRRGKLWLAENDTRTALTTPLRERAPAIAPPGQYEGGVWEGPETLDDSVALLRKNAARMLACGYGGWWFDMWGGWFSDPRLMDVLRRAQELGEEELHRRVSGTEPQVAVVVDDTLAFRDGTFGRLAEEILGNRYALGKIGTGYELHLREDLPHLDADTVRFVWLLGLADLDPSEADVLRTLEERGAHVLHTGLTGSTLHGEGRVTREMPGTVRFEPPLLRSFLRAAGVHVYLDTDDVVYAGNGWLAIHTRDGGRRRVALPFPARVTDAFRDVPVAERADGLDLDLPPRSTLLLRLEPTS